MSKQEYETNRRRVAEILGVDIKDGEHSCHHAYIYRQDTKRNPKLKDRVDKIENLFVLTNEDHARVHELDGTNIKPRNKRHR
jgi:hypothetical protein